MKVVNSPELAERRSDIAQDHLLTYAEHGALIERVIASVCRRHHLGADDASEFTSWARERLIDGVALSKFEGRCQPRTFLFVVVGRLFLDYRNACWGKYRPSAQARRLGETAVMLERLLARDGYSFEEAAQILQTNFRLDVEMAELTRLASRLPVRVRPVHVSEEQLEYVKSTSGDPEATTLDAERQKRRARVYRAMAAALPRLEPQDQLLLKMRFVDGLTLASIARTLSLDQKLLYRKVERVLRDLRASLLSHGVTAEDASDVLSHLDDGAGNGE